MAFAVIGDSSPHRSPNQIARPNAGGRFDIRSRSPCPWPGAGQLSVASDASLVMTTLELLRQDASELASQIDTAGEQQLRRISSGIAHAVVERSGLSHPVINEALQHLSTSAQPHPELRARVRALAEQLDADYFDLKQLYEKGEDAGKTEPAVVAAFARARAASAVAAALGDLARTAAAETAYEALAADDDSVYLISVAQSALTI